MLQKKKKNGGAVEAHYEKEERNSSFELQAQSSFLKESIMSRKMIFQVLGMTGNF